MSLFEFDSGHLVPAQFGRATPARLEDDMLEAVHAQVLELVGRPLFPVVWGRSAQSQLLAMDAAGQVVTVEIIELLDAAALVAALARAGNSAALGWLDLAAMYPAGAGTFRTDWNEFREALPPRTPAGPRVVIVASEISDDVRPALELLAGSGVEVHELTVREFSDGKRFLDVAPVRGPIAQRSQLMLLGRSAKYSEIAPVSEPEDEIPEPDEPFDPMERLAAEAAAAHEREEPEERADLDELDLATETPSYTAPLGPAALALREIAEYVGEDTRLIWRQLRRGIHHEATLRVTGELVTEAGEKFRDPDTAAGAVSGREDVDGWRVWRFGEAGPNLADARAELAEADEPSSGRRSR